MGVDFFPSSFFSPCFFFFLKYETQTDLILACAGLRLPPLRDLWHVAAAVDVQSSPPGGDAECAAISLCITGPMAISVARASGRGTPSKSISFQPGWFFCQHGWVVAFGWFHWLLLPTDMGGPAFVLRQALRPQVDCPYACAPSSVELTDGRNRRFRKERTRDALPLLGNFRISALIRTELARKDQRWKKSSATLLPVISHVTHSCSSSSFLPPEDLWGASHSPPSRPVLLDRWFSPMDQL